MRVVNSSSEEQTKALGQELASSLKEAICICLYGDLGSGKTVFTKGLALGLGISENKIKSPTYTLMRSYQLPATNFGKGAHFYHYDFYRVEAVDELMAHDLEEILTQKNAIVVIEWPERVATLLPEKRLNISFEHVNPTERRIKFQILSTKSQP